MASLKSGNNRDNCSGDITHRQPIGKKISYRPYKRIASFNGYFLKVDFLDWLLDLEDVFDYENICYQRKVGLALYKLSKYALCWLKQVQSNRIQQGKNKIRSWPRMKKMLAIKFYPLDCEEILSYTIQNYYWPRNSYMNYFEEPNIPPLEEELHVKENIILERYGEVKEKNIEISEEINECLVIGEKPKIKIVEEINEYPIIEKDLEAEIVKTIKEEIVEEVVNDLDEIKLDDCNIQTPIILLGDTKTKFIDFIGVEIFDLIIDSYLENIVNYMKIKEEEVQVAQLMTFKFGKKTKKMKYSKYLFSWHGISKMNLRTSLFQVEGSDVKHKYYLIIIIYYFWYFYVKNVILGLADLLFPCF